MATSENSGANHHENYSFREDSINDLSLFEGASVVLPDRPMGLYGDDYPDEISSLNSSICRPEHTLAGFGFNNANNNNSFDLRMVARHHGHVGNEGPVDTSLTKNDSRETKDTSKSSHSDPMESANRQNKNPKRTFFPKWFHRSPNWLQIVVMFSVALLVGAAVLVAVGLTLALQGDNSDSTSPTTTENQQSTLNGDNEGAPVSPDEVSTFAPPNKDEEEPSFFATSAPSFPPRIRSPTPAPTLTVTLSPTPDTSASPTALINFEDELKFYVTAGRYEHLLLQEAPDKLNKLPKRAGTSFLVHLGDWNNPTTCDESSFAQVVELYQSSSVPVYFVVGDQEFTDCSDPAQAMELWKSNLVNYETRYWEQPSWDLWRQGQGYEENFAFDFMDAAFASINLVDEQWPAPPTDTAWAPELELEHEEWLLDERLQANLDWIDELYKDYKRQVSMMFIFSNAGPKGDGPNKAFFESLFDQIETRYAQMRFVLVHRSGLQPDRYGIEKKYNGIENLDVISVLGPIWPPLEITVNTREKDPSKAVSISLHEWYDSL